MITLLRYDPVAYHTNSTHVQMHFNIQIMIYIINKAMVTSNQGEGGESNQVVGAGTGEAVGLVGPVEDGVVGLGGEDPETGGSSCLIWKSLISVPFHGLERACMEEMYACPQSMLLNQMTSASPHWNLRMKIPCRWGRMPTMVIERKKSSTWASVVRPSDVHFSSTSGTK